MKKYISILRGINVSGKNKILMADLKSLYEGLGCLEVTTYIQSGNVIFKSDMDSANELKLAIESALEEKFKFRVPIVFFTDDEFNSIVENLPFKKIDLVTQGTKFLISFLFEAPLESCIEELKEYVNRPEELFIKGQAAYLHCPNGYGKSKLSNTFIEKKLNVTATTRNIKTVYTLQSLLNKDTE